MWDDQETEFLSEDYALTTTTAEAEQVPLSDDCTLIANEDDRKALHLCIWLVDYLTHLQVVFHLPDGAMQSILKFFSAFFTVLSKISPVCSTIAIKFPRSVHLLHTSIIKQSFTKYVVCQ